MTSYAFPWMMTQQDSLLLCFAISSPLSWTACLLLLSRFMVTDRSPSSNRGTRYEVHLGEVAGTVLNAVIEQGESLSEGEYI